VRPTSETVIGEYMAKWIQSHRDLPLLLNQWANVVRWELRPRLFLRTSEFLWQEGHTAHATYDDARAYAERILRECYADFMINELAMPIVMGRKTTRERFPGAINTLACEGMMADGKALQMGTSHELGQNFAKAFEIMYQSSSGQRELVWTTSWGTSTRMVGGLIMCHGDDSGLVVPPRVAPVQAVVLLVKADGGAGEAAEKLAAELKAAGVRVQLDARTDIGFGRRAVDWELKGAPVRIEAGPRDIADGNVTVVRRDQPGKQTVAAAGVAAMIGDLLVTIQDDLLAHATERRDARIHDAESVEAVTEVVLAGNWARIGYQALKAADGENRLREQAITVRCLQQPDGSIPDGEDHPDTIAFVAKAY
jgi:prolyl-tRNA synthetase